MNAMQAGAGFPFPDEYELGFTIPRTDAGDVDVKALIKGGSPALWAIPTEEQDLKRVQYLDIRTLDSRIPEYGRKIAQSNIGRILREGWNHIGASFLIVSMRADGTLVLIDGNHRRIAALSLGIYRLRAYVIPGLTIEDEARLFVYLNSSKAPTAIDLFHADVRAGKPEVVDIVRILAKHGLKVARQEGGKPGHGTVTTALELRKTYDVLGPDLFEGVVLTLKEAWGFEYTAWGSRIFGGMRAFYSRYAGDFKRADLVARLRVEMPDTVLTKSKTQGTSGESVENKIGQYILKQYNVRRTSHRLPDWTPLPTKTKGTSALGSDRREGGQALARIKALEKQEEQQA